MNNSKPTRMFLHKGTVVVFLNNINLWTLSAQAPAKEA